MSSLIHSLKSVAGVLLGAALLAAAPAMADSYKEPVAPPGGFSFEGPFGTFDQASLQRGYKVYREVCANCHSMKLMYFRNLGQIGGPFYDPKYKNPNENPVVKEIASNTISPISIPIPATTRPARVRRPTASIRRSRMMPRPRRRTVAALPPDLSVMAKAREGGALYLLRLDRASFRRRRQASKSPTRNTTIPASTVTWRRNGPATRTRCRRGASWLCRRRCAPTVR